MGEIVISRPKNQKKKVPQKSELEPFFCGNVTETPSVHVHCRPVYVNPRTQVRVNPCVCARARRSRVVTTPMRTHTTHPDSPTRRDDTHTHNTHIALRLARHRSARTRTHTPTPTVGPPKPTEVRHACCTRVCVCPSWTDHREESHTHTPLDLCDMMTRRHPTLLTHHQICASPS